MKLSAALLIMVVPMLFAATIEIGSSMIGNTKPFCAD